MRRGCGSNRPLRRAVYHAAFPRSRAGLRHTRLMAGRLLVVSNRLPLSIRKSKDGRWRSEATSGGLQSAMAPILERRGGVWIGWPGYGPRARDEGWDAQVARWRSEHGYVAVDLPSDLARKFYQGYANQTLWPLFPSFTPRFDYAAALWRPTSRPTGGSAMPSSRSS